MSLDESTPKRTEHEAIYARVRELILFGGLAPGAAVTIHGLRQETQAGMTPMREALRRLTAEGALEAGSNRRLYVPQLGMQDLEEIRLARLAIEPEMAALACPNLTDNDVSTLINLDKGVDRAIASGDISGYLECNYRFHFALYDRAGTRILRRMAQMLWLRAGPSLRVVCGRFGTSNLPDKHTEAIAALQAKDANAVRAAMHEDISQGMDQIRTALEGGKI